jgi:hypothetical protein
MTRLDSVIRRLQAQRALLDWASRDIAGLPGLVLELGLGNGRTFDHLRSRLPDRKIYAFERRPAAHPDCLPGPEYLIVGDVLDTLPRFLDRQGAGCAALAHVDIGTGDERENDRLSRRLSPLLAPLLAPGGLLLADRAFDLPGCDDVSLLTGVESGRYFVYRQRPCRTVRRADAAPDRPVSGMYPRGAKASAMPAGRDRERRDDLLSTPESPHWRKRDTR